jgi:SAM-dependent methyltransferase
MKPTWKECLRQLTPPILWRFLRFIYLKCRLLLPQTKAEQRRSQVAEAYDEFYRRSDSDLQLHYTLSRYYYLWCVVADRITRADCRSLLEIGCGAGQLAAMFRDKGIKKYQGFDFSRPAIDIAKINCPQFNFWVADVYDTDIFETCDYDTVVCTEVLEHLERDLDVLKRVRQGTKVIFTVPNFPDPLHERHFSNSFEIEQRYGILFDQLHIDSFLADKNGTVFYLCEGVKRAN